MASPFLENVAQHVRQKYEDKTDQVCIVLPSRRAAVFLKQHFARVYARTIWLPRIISAEELIESLSGLRVPEELDLICRLYDAYREVFGADAESFDGFARWGQMILQDFNEIDRYLADPVQIYENLKDIKVIEQWSLGEETLTQAQQNYVRFMGGIGEIYRRYSARLTADGLAYQGLAYRHAAANVRNHAALDFPQNILFCGFNALNAAETHIFRHLADAGRAEFLWDADKYYVGNKEQEAGMFMRRNIEVFGKIETGSYFSSRKEINIISVPRQVGQSQVMKQVLQQFLSEGISMSDVVVVLANEKLLGPVLHQLPAGIGGVNITMEYPVRYSATFALLDLIIRIHQQFDRQHGKAKTVYHKDFVALMRMPLLRTCLRARGSTLDPSRVVSETIAGNFSFLRRNELSALLKNDEAATALFEPRGNAKELSDLLLDILDSLAAALKMAESLNHALELEYVQVLRTNFIRLHELNAQFDHFREIQGFRHFFTQIVGNASVPFVGEPLTGLQIMGVLETRTLDFKHVIMLNVNEGVLPSGKSANSFLPNDLKRAFGLPLYVEKDAIYAYHFYRLLQRARTAHIVCDSETDTFGKGEQSRFVTQLMMELPGYSPETEINFSTAFQSPAAHKQNGSPAVERSQAVTDVILTRLTSGEPFNGLSPSAIIAFKECTLRYYFRYGAGLREPGAVEETADAGTFGSILHTVIEKIYAPLTGVIASGDAITKEANRIAALIEAEYNDFTGGYVSGKNILQQEVMKVYLEKLIRNDRHLADSNSLMIVHLEHEMLAQLPVQFRGETVNIHVRGKSDRLDRVDNWFRVIDYKSSVKASDKFTLDDMSLLFTDPDHNKLLQLMIYAWLVYRNNMADVQCIRPCIISFREFEKQPRYIMDSSGRIMTLTHELLAAFELQLSGFVEKMLVEEDPFSPAEDTARCEFCAYRVICNR